MCVLNLTLTLTLSEMRPKTASVIFDVDRYEWNDAAWQEKA